MFLQSVGCFNQTDLTIELNPKGVIASIDTNLLQIPTASSNVFCLASFVFSWDSLTTSLKIEISKLITTSKQGGILKYGQNAPARYLKLVAHNQNSIKLCPGLKVGDESINSIKHDKMESFFKISAMCIPELMK